MKKLILVLAILLATPVFGALSISLQQQTPDGNYIDLNYAGADPCNLPRAFGLNVEVNSPMTITAVSNYKTGESNSTSKGFGIFPARIVIEANGTVTSWGTPLADPCDPGAGTGLGTNKVVLELGSLYFGDTNAPATSGTLCTLKVACNGASGVLSALATEEDTYRGGVVLEDGTAPSPNLSATLNLSTLCGPPCPGQASGPNPANGATGVARTTNLSWTAGSDANSHRIYFSLDGNLPPASFVAEQSGTTYDPNSAGNLGQGRMFYWRIDEKNSCGTTAGVTWNFRVEECYKDPCTVRYNAWVTWGRPDCWCYQRQCRGDINGRKNLQWVQALDLGILTTAYGKTDAVLATIPSGICADLNHIKNLQRVQALDLGILTPYYGKSDALTPVCDSNWVNFWTN